MGEVAFARYSSHRAPDETRAIRKIVDSYGYTWGFQWRRNFGSDARFPISSFAGKLKDQGEGAVFGEAWDRKYAEVFIGGALEFAAALKYTDEGTRIMAWIHYVVDMPKKAKAPILDIHVNTYDQRKKTMQLRMARLLNIDCV